LRLRRSSISSPRDGGADLVWKDRFPQRALWD
jgi:hypothetical protein